MFFKHTFFKMETVFLQWMSLLGALRLPPLLRGFPESPAAGYFSQHGPVQGPGPKLDRNQSFHSMAQGVKVSMTRVRQ